MYRFQNVPQGGDVLTFLDLILATNAACAEAEHEVVFGSPTFLGRSDQYENRYIEQYPEAVVIGPLQTHDDGVRVVPRTTRAAHFMRLGAIAIGYPVIPNEGVRLLSEAVANYTQ